MNPLPIYDVEAQLIDRLRATKRVILSAPTGSGKSTQVPQMLLKHGLLASGEVVILQPRRIAARMLAARVASELGVPLGREVGYQVRLDNVTSAATKIRFVTEGILLRRMIDNPALPGVAALIFDEFHERHLYSDITLARALDLRPDLPIIVMSATLDVEKLEAFLQPCATVTSAGRTFPVDIRYAPGPAPSRVEGEAAAAFAQHRTDGDTLIFMPGSYEIHRTIEAIRALPEAKGRDLLPLHGELSPKDQDAAVARGTRPKIVVATNVAETSLTIDGVTLVIDSGLARIARYDPNRGINTLFVEKISRASADQRAGRAGRTAPGTCIRLWSEREQRAAREQPEVMRVDLAEALLMIRAAGLKELRWLDPPPPKSLVDAEELLTDLGALEKGLITPLGRRMLAFPLHPRYARMLLAAQEFGGVRDAALVAALTQGRDLLIRGVAEFQSDDSDFRTLIKAWRWAADRNFDLEACKRAGIHAATARQVGPLYDQFLRIAGVDREGDADALRKCVLVGFADRVAKRLDEGTLRCEIVHGRTGVLAKESAARGASLIVAAEVREVEGRKIETLLSLATSIEPGWLGELFPAAMNTHVEVAYDPGPKRVVAKEHRRYHDLPLETREIEPPADEAARLLADEVVAGRLRLDAWDAGVEQWIFRVNLLARACPEFGIGPIGAAERRSIVEQICHGARSHKEIRERSVRAVVRGWLNGAQQDLVEKHAPERLKLANGKTPKVTYEAEGAPFLSARIQDLYDVPRIPGLAMGRVAPLLHILAPSQRPVQITQDLEGFWRDHYPKLKKELARKYPRHEWR